MNCTTPLHTHLKHSPDIDLLHGIAHSAVLGHVVISDILAGLHMRITGIKALLEGVGSCGVGAIGSCGNVPVGSESFIHIS